MKSIFKGIKKIVTSWPFIITLLVLGVGVIATAFMLPTYNSDTNAMAYFTFPTCVASAGDNRYAIIDNYSICYIAKGNEEVGYRCQAAIICDKEETLELVTFDDKGNLYLLISNEDEYYINQYDRNGNFVRLVMSEDGEGIDNLYALNYYDGKINFVQAYTDDTAELIACSLASTDMERTSLPSKDNGAYVVEAVAGSDNSYALIYVDRSLALLRTDGSIRDIRESDFDYFENPDGEIIETAIPYKDGILVIFGNYQNDMIYYLAPDEDEELVPIIDGHEAYPWVDENDECGIWWIAGDDDRISFSIYDTAYVYSDDQLTEIDMLDTLPINVIIVNLINNVLSDIGLILIIIGIILLVGNIMKWRFTLLSKQIFVTVPIVVLMFAFATKNFIDEYDKFYTDSVANELLEFSDIVINSFDGNELSTMSNYEAVRDGRTKELEQKLSDMLNNKESEWSKNMSASIYLTRDGCEGLLLATTDWNDAAFLSSLSIESIEQIKEDYVNGEEYIKRISGDTVVMITGTYTTDYLTAITPIYDSEGNQVAMLVGEIGYEEYETTKEMFIFELVLKISGFMLIFIIALIILTYINTRRLKAAERAITEIAAGNFDARINRVGNDEVGAICGGVNEMAKQLEDHFEELDRNEKFYYKFVPEKFRELLHKDAFTDLKLGDAESADLTVLFCDIRSFSLNSEMMTAKENFEFVNIIYGKTGPIIREHQGFVDKYIGDAVMALFENADDAVAAGIEIYKEIVLNPETAKALGVEEINIGIGIHSGMARVGIVGEDQRLSGTVISNTVNISSRLESLTKQYKTAMLITKETLDRLSDPDSLNVRYLGMVQVAGVNEVKALYEVLDCLGEEKKAIRTKNAHEFREAIKQFHMGNAEMAVAMLEKLDTKNPADTVPEKYIDYIKEKIEAGDSTHNVFRFSRK